MATYPVPLRARIGPRFITNLWQLLSCIFEIYKLSISHLHHLTLLIISLDPPKPRRARAFPASLPTPSACWRLIRRLSILSDLFPRAVQLFGCSVVLTYLMLSLISRFSLPPNRIEVPRLCDQIARLLLMQSYLTNSFRPGLSSPVYK